MSTEFDTLLQAVESCTICEAALPSGPRPVVQFHPDARVLIAGQAPGRRVHESGIPFDDPSGDRLREWMGIDRETFYDSTKVAILPMGFCYPGTGRSGDLPPRKECAPAWRRELLGYLPRLDLTLVIGTYALKWHLADLKARNLTEAVRLSPGLSERRTLVLPHPSPRNNIWLRKNPWFSTEVLPLVRQGVARSLTPH